MNGRRGAAQRILFCVSGHGLGHATRIRALIDALRERAASSIGVQVRTEAPHWVFSERGADTPCSRARLDEGVLQVGGLDLDLEGTLAAHEAFAKGWERALDRETAWILDQGPSLVVGDIPPLAFAAAARAGVPAVGIANFSWDWILEPYAQREARFEPVIARYREAYGKASVLYRLPFAGAFDAFPNVVDVPLLVNHSRRTRDECRRALGIASGDTRKLVLVSFGGFARVANAPHRDESLDDYRFVDVGPEGPARPDRRGAWLTLPSPSPIPHEDLVNACDAILGKPGYGSVAEAIVHGTRFLHLPREGFREVPILEDGLARYCSSLEMPREDFEAGRWRPHLDALFAQSPPTATLSSDGAGVLADELCRRLGVE